jgi:hypothetical protein
MWVIVCVYGPGREKKDDERKRFWEALSDYEWVLTV